jgi:hypothetical protein
MMMEDEEDRIKVWKEMVNSRVAGAPMTYSARSGASQAGLMRLKLLVISLRRPAARNENKTRERVEPAPTTRLRGKSKIAQS